MSKPIEFNISDLVPYESAAIYSTVEIKKQQIIQKHLLKLPRVVIVEDTPMVKDGNNTVLAYKQLNFSKIKCTIEILNDFEIQPFIDTLKLRRQKNQIGFNNFPILQSDDERAKLTLEEANKINNDSMWETLAKGLDENAEK